MPQLPGAAEWDSILFAACLTLIDAIAISTLAFIAIALAMVRNSTSMIVDKDFLLSVALPLAEAAYQVTPGPSSFAPPCGFTLASLIKLDAPIGGLSIDNPYFGFMAVREKVIYIAIRGTQSLDEWIKDFDAAPVELNNYAVHAGFNAVLESLFPSIRQAIWSLARADFEICVIGHSLGAALASLIALKLSAGTSLPVNCIAFASPRVGDANFGRAVRRSIDLLRVTNTKDLVTHVPPRPEYVHAGDAVAFDGWDFAAGIEQKLDAKFAHSLEQSYLPGVQSMPNRLTRIELD
ncbi:MAG TPA: lipase family protein [Bryobacteraceae bacterium]|nr:lipase family protein [Bryobacteraceae bacterium]